VIGLDLSDTVAVGTGVAREFAAHHHSSSKSRMNPWLSTTFPSCVIGT
jgi:hypothetical protein